MFVQTDIIPNEKQEMYILPSGSVMPITGGNQTKTKDCAIGPDILPQAANLTPPVPSESKPEPPKKPFKFVPGAILEIEGYIFKIKSVNPGTMRLKLLEKAK